jgi:thioester reductase-like protein
LQSTSFRIGQISGGFPSGAWSKAEWVPILVKSSLALGVLPSAFGVVSWLPAPAVAQILLDVAFSTEDRIPALNVVHPRPVPWTSIISAINDALVQEGVLKELLAIVEFSEWFEMLEIRAREDSSTRNIDDIVCIQKKSFGFAVEH